MKTKKVNNLKKATSKVAFLFASALVFSPCISSLPSCEATSEDVHSEIISSSCSNEVKAAGSNKTMKQANRKNIDTTSYQLTGYDYSDNTISLTYDVCSSYITLSDGNTIFLFNNLYLSYDMNDDNYTYYEFEIEVYDDNNSFYFMEYYYPNDFLNYLNSDNIDNSSYVDTYFDGNVVGFEYSDTTNNYYFSFSDTVNETVSTLDFLFIGSEFYIGDIIAEKFILANLSNSKLEQGYGAGFEVGSEEGYEEGYNDGYDIGSEEGYEDGYNDGYDIGSEEGYIQGQIDSQFAYIGPLANLPLRFGLYNVDTDEYDYSTNVFINQDFSETLELLNGGFKIVGWDGYEEMYSNEEVVQSDYVFAFTIPFGANGVRIDNINRLFPIKSDNVPYLQFGQELTIKTTTNTYTWNGADQYALQYIDFETFQNGVLKNSLITSIQMIGSNADYIPYGLMTNNDYSIGYEKGYDNGFTSGVLDGREQGYENGFEDGKIASGTTYADGYNKGYLDAKNQYQNVEAISFEDVLSAVITAPNKIIREGFDFDILGINVGSFIQTCIVIGLIVFTIGLFKKG